MENRVAPEDGEYRIVVFGQAGYGKTTVCNALLGRDQFAAGIPTQTADIGQCKKNGLVVKVVDTPDVVTANLKLKGQMAEVKKWKIFVFPRATIMLLVVRGDVQYTERDWLLYQQIRRLWGKGSTRERLKVISTFSQGQSLQQVKTRMAGDCWKWTDKLLSECGGHLLVFHGQTSDNLLEEVMKDDFQQEEQTSTGNTKSSVVPGIINLQAGKQAPDQLRELKEDQLRELKEDQLRELKGDQLREQKGDQLKELKREKLREIKEDHLRELKGDQLRELTGDQLRELKEDQLRELKEDQLRELKGDQLRELKGDQLRELKGDQLRELKEDQLRELKGDQLRELNEDQLRELKGDQLRELKGDQLRELKEDQLRELKEDQLRELKGDQLRELKGDQLRELKEDHLRELKRDQLRELKGDQLRELKGDQLRELKGDQLRELKGDQLRELKGDQLRELKEDHLRELKGDQLRELKGDQWRELEGDRGEATQRRQSGEEDSWVGANVDGDRGYIRGCDSDRGGGYGGTTASDGYKSAGPLGCCSGRCNREQSGQGSCWRYFCQLCQCCKKQ